MALNSKQGSAPNVPFVNTGSYCSCNQMEFLKVYHICPTGKIRWKAVREEWRKGAPQKSAQVKKGEAYQKILLNIQRCTYFISSLTFHHVFILEP